MTVKSEHGEAAAIKATEAKNNQSCSMGGCGSGGVCPGMAIGIGMIVSTLLAAVLPYLWLSYGIGILITIFLILGIYPTGKRWPFR